MLLWAIPQYKQKSLKSHMLLWDTVGKQNPKSHSISKNVQNPTVKTPHMVGFLNPTVSHIPQYRNGLPQGPRYVALVIYTHFNTQFHANVFPFISNI